MANKIGEKIPAALKKQRKVVSSLLICRFTHAHALHMHSRAPDYQSKTHACALSYVRVHNTVAKPPPLIE